MATAPFGDVLEDQLKEAEQGGRCHVCIGFVISPNSFCCVSGTTVGVYKDPVAHMAVDKQMACIGEAVTVTYSGSWSPSGTIATWEVDWGDGNVTNGAWPGAGTSAHPAGGYILDGTYTITLTVVDLLGAIGTAEIQIEIVDCTLYPDIEAFCGCGASGVWYTITGGRLWEQRGLAGVEIYDLKVMPYSVGQKQRRLWAATANGLYRSQDDGKTWIPVALPDAGALAVALAPSRVRSHEIWVAATVAGAAPKLYMTADYGQHWRSIELLMEAWTEVPNGVLNDVLGIGYIPGRLFAGGSQGLEPSWCDVWNSIGDWVNPGPWGPAHDGLDNITNCITVTPGGTLYAGGVFLNSCGNPMRMVARWTGPLGGWAAVGAVNFTDECEALAWDDNSNLLYAGGHAAFYCQVWNGAAWAEVGGADGLNGTVRGLAVAADATMDPIGTVYAGGAFTGTLLGTTVNHIGKWDGANWSQLGGGLNGTVHEITIGPDGYLYICGVFTAATQPDSSVIVVNRVVRWNGTEFEALGEGLGAGTCYGIAVDDNGRVFVGGSYTTLGDNTTACLRIASYDGTSWSQVGDGFDATVRVVYWSPLQQRIYAGGDFTNTGATNCDHIAYLSHTNYTFPTVGRTHILDLDAGSKYAYVGVLTLGGLPRILRVPWLMDQDPVMIYGTGFGTWGGVRADWNYFGRVWYFGDFGTTKVLMSEDWGSLETDLTDAGWAAGEIVRPVMPSVYNPADVIAILNVALEAYQSGDDGGTWAKTGDTHFAAACGERDWVDPRGIYIGNVGPAPTGPQHLRYTLNRGIYWMERSAAITADAPIVALQIVG